MTQTASAPVAIFAYNRPEHLLRTLRSLTACTGLDQAPVTVFCDGARSPAQADAVAQARAVVHEVLGSKVDARFARENKGLARSILGGVTELVQAHGRVIVIEDDFDLAPGFLTYMNAALHRYADEPQVYQVSGHMFDVPEFAGRDRAMLLPFTTTWGWGTWARAWGAFDPAATGWQRVTRDRALRKRFNLGGVYDYATMLERQMAGKRDSWGIRWYWSVFQQDGLTVFPPATLVRNTGQDGSGTHGGGSIRTFSDAASQMQWPGAITMPDEPAAVDQAGYEAVCRAIWRQNGGWLGRVVDLGKRVIKR